MGISAQDAEAAQNAVMSIAVETWRFKGTLDRLFQKELDAGRGKRYESQFRYFWRKVEEALDRAGLKIVDHQGQPYDIGMAVKAVNIEEFGDGDTLVVDRMLEPIILNKDGQIQKTGAVTLRKIQQ